MASSPLYLPPSRSQSSSLSLVWIPVLGALTFICFTSTTFMGGWHTQIWVNKAWHALFGNWDSQITGEVNLVGRKVGHFFGYGSIGLLFRRAWYSSLRRHAMAAGTKLAWTAAILGIGSTFLAASLDEWHQTFLPRRVGCFGDVMIDTCGATLLICVLYAFRSLRRRRYIAAQ